MLIILPSKTMSAIRVIVRVRALHRWFRIFIFCPPKHSNYVNGLGQIPQEHLCLIPNFWSSHFLTSFFLLRCFILNPMILGVKVSCSRVLADFYLRSLATQMCPHKATWCSGCRNHLSLCTKKCAFLSTEFHIQAQCIQGNVRVHSVCFIRDTL